MRLGLALLSWIVAIWVVACGGSPPAASPTSTSTAGADAIAAGGADDVMLTMDLAGMRANPVLARALAEGRAKGGADVGEIVEKVDRIDLRAAVPKDGVPAMVAVMWGKLARDPRQFAAFNTLAGEPKALASGVQEWTEGSGAAHVFVLDDKVWVVTSGTMTDRARDHFAKSATPPSAPTGDLLRLRANGAALARSPAQVLGGLDKLDVALTSGASSLRAVLSFKDGDAAKKAETQVRGLSELLTLAIAGNKECKALEKLSIDIGTQNKDVAVEVKGIAAAVASWDAKTCPQPSSPTASFDEAGPVAPVQPPPPPVDPNASGNAPTKKNLCAVFTKRHTSPVSPKVHTGPRKDYAEKVESFEGMLAEPSATDADRGQKVVQLAFAYGQWEVAAKRDCAANKTTKATVRDVKIAGMVTNRLPALCAELAKLHHEFQCKW